MLLVMDFDCSFCLFLLCPFLPGSKGKLQLNFLKRCNRNGNISFYYFHVESTKDILAWILLSFKHLQCMYQLVILFFLFHIDIEMFLISIQFVHSSNNAIFNYIITTRSKVFLDALLVECKSFSCFNLRHFF